MSAFLERPVPRRQILQAFGYGTAYWVLGPLLSACSREAEESFFDELQRFPLREQLSRIDERYSEELLSPGIAERYVVPIWIEAYIQASRSRKTKREILSLLNLHPAEKEQLSIEPGRVEIDLDARAIERLEFDIEFTPSNRPFQHPGSGEEAAGIIYLRSGLTHELVHFDTQFRDDPYLGRLLYEKADEELTVENPNSLLTNGFNIFELKPDQRTTIYFPLFDDAVSDVIQSFIAESLGRPSVMLYGLSPSYRDFFEWIQFPKDILIALHQASNVTGLARTLGILSAEKRGSNSGDKDQLVLDGIDIIRTLSRADAQGMEQYFPGFTQVVLSHDPVYIR